MESSTDMTSSHNPQDNLTAFLFSFHRYGLPGVVIGVLFLFNGGLTYYGIRSMHNNTKAMIEMAEAARGMREALRDCGRD